MTPGQIIALVRDVAIVAALGWILWKVYSDGENRIRTQDLKAVQQQLQDNAKLVAQWHQEAQQANSQRQQDMATIASRIAAQRDSIIVRQPACPHSVPAVPATTASSDSGSGGTDIRPGINRFELKYEAALADCRAALAQWPQ